MAADDLVTNESKSLVTQERQACRAGRPIGWRDGSASINSVEVLLSGASQTVGVWGFLTHAPPKLWVLRVLATSCDNSQASVESSYLLP